MIYKLSVNVINPAGGSDYTFSSSITVKPAANIVFR